MSRDTKYTDDSPTKDNSKCNEHLEKVEDDCNQCQIELFAWLDSNRLIGDKAN